MPCNLDKQQDSENLHIMMSFENDRERLLKNRTMIRKNIIQCIKSNGFTQKGRSTFYMINEDIVGYFVLEHPSNRMYISFCIYPLFMPPMQYIHLMFSKRISTVLSDSNLNISDYISEEQLKASCVKIDNYIKTRVLPFIAGVNTSEKLVNTINLKNNFFNTIIAASIENKYKMKMYTELSLHAYSDAIDSANTFLALSDSPRYTDTVRSSDIDEYQNFIALAQTRNDVHIDGIITEWKKQNMEFFTGKRS